MPASKNDAHALSTTIALAVVHAVLFAAMLPPINFWPAAFLVPVPAAFLAIGAKSGRRAVVVMFVAQTVLWLWLNRWIMPITTAGHIPLSLYMAAYPTLLVALIRLVDSTRVKRYVPWCILLPGLWCATEFARGEVVADGYPWYLVAHPLIATPSAVQSADLFGVYFLGLLTVMPAGALLDLRNNNRRRFIWASAAAIVWIANIAYGSWRLNQTEGLSDGPTLLLVQTNLPQSNKIDWTAEQQAIDFAEFVALTREGVADSDAAFDLIVWPETMTPGVGFEPETLSLLEEQFGEHAAHLYQYPKLVEQLAAELNTPMLVGSSAWVDVEIQPGEEENTVRLEPTYRYNSAYLVDGRNPPQRYDKYFLTPFGETMPYISNWPWLEQKLLAFGADGMSFNLDRNPNINRIALVTNTGEPVVLGTPICFEDTSARTVRRMTYPGGEKRVQLLVNLSNDGWFGDYDFGREMHCQAARFRTIENRVPMVRAANTGYTVSIDSAGNLIGRVGEGRYGESRQAGILAAETTLDDRRTMYSRVGDIWGWFCLAATALLTVIGIIDRRRTKR